MHARITSSPVQPGKLDELIHIFEDVIVPAAEAQPGFKGGFLLTDRETNKFVSISLWETEAVMRSAENSEYYQEQTAKIAPVLAAAPDKEAYTVSATA